MLFSKPFIISDVLTMFSQVVQIYIEWLDSSLSTPKLQLVFFNRYILTAGQRDLVVPFKIEAHQMAVWMNEGWVVPNGETDSQTTWGCSVVTC